MGAHNFCSFLNNQKLDKDNFIHARYAEEMVEYEMKKPFVADFDQIFEYCRYYNDDKIFLDDYHHVKQEIIKDTLKKIRADIFLTAFKGLDKRSRELIIHYLPAKTADEINEEFKKSDRGDFLRNISLKDTLNARLKIINSINKNISKNLDKHLAKHREEYRVLKA